MVAALYLQHVGMPLSWVMYPGVNEISWLTENTLPGCVIGLLFEVLFSLLRQGCRVALPYALAVLMGMLQVPSLRGRNPMFAMSYNFLIDTWLILAAGGGRTIWCPAPSQFAMLKTEETKRLYVQVTECWRKREAKRQVVVLA